MESFQVNGTKVITFVNKNDADIQNWLRNNDNVEILKILQSMSDGPASCNDILRIFYRE